MRKPNAIIEALKVCPCIAESLPYRLAAHRFAVKDRLLIQKIHVTGHRRRENQLPHAQFKTVYYLTGDVDRAVELFVKVNFEILSNLNFKGNNLLHSGTQKNIVKKIVTEFKSQSKTFKVLTPKGL